MSDKEMVQDLIQKLPEDSTLEQIHQEVSFVAGLRAAEAQADRGELIDHAHIRQELATWTSS
jgi:predicted transcriptional regulator